jgi:hypothetical protein
MRYVAVKSIEQQDIQAVHRVRASLISELGKRPFYAPRLSEQPYRSLCYLLSLIPRAGELVGSGLP